MSSSSSSQREYETIYFLLFKKTPSSKEVFKEVSESTLQVGDIVLFPLECSPGDQTNTLKHAAVYCGDGEIIHFQNTNVKENKGRITKEGFRAMRKERGKCQIYRKKSGIDLNDFRSKVREAMNCEASYHAGKNNCIHFALYLLGLLEFYMELVEIKKEGDCSGGGAMSNYMV